MPETITDKKLIQQYLEGDDKSFEILIQKYLKMIYGFAYKNVGNTADAEDITQEVFVKVWKNIKKFKQDRDFKPWIFQIAKNTSIDFLRKKKTIPFSRFENDKGQNAIVENIVSTPVDLIKGFGDKRAIEVAMRGLTDKEQEIINLRHNQGLSFKEIAQISKESINTVKSRYRRTLANLRKNIKEN